MPANDSNFAMARYTTAGVLDAGFGTGGKVITDFGGFDEASALALQADGKLIQAGMFFPFPNLDGTPFAFFALSRHNADGSIDSIFGTGGKITTDFFSLDSRATAVVIQTDGKIVAGGYADTGSSIDFALARYNLATTPTPTPTPTPTSTPTPTKRRRPLQRRHPHFRRRCRLFSVNFARTGPMDQRMNLWKSLTVAAHHTASGELTVPVTAFLHQPGTAPLPTLSNWSALFRKAP